MHHNYEVGNIVRLKSTGNLMKISSICKEPFDGSLSGFIVCQWETNGHIDKRTFHVNDIEFVSVGDAQGYDMDNNSLNTVW